MHIGSKYKARRSSKLGDQHGGTIFECVYRSPETDGTASIAVLRVPDNSSYLQDFVFEYSKWDDLEEYTEPHKEYFNAYRDSLTKRIRYDGPYETEALADYNCYRKVEYYGRLIMIHHSETHVDVEFHLKRGK